MRSVYSIQNMPVEERPRERLIRFGPEAMSTVELIAVILGSGTKTVPVLQLAHELVARFGSLRGLSEATLEELCQIKGVGSAKAVQLKAAFNLGLRASKPDIFPKFHVQHPLHVYHLVKDELEKETREVFVAILKDVKGNLIRSKVIAIGTLSKTLIHPREVFHLAIRHKAASIILAHNHPSGDPTPSSEDFEVTDILVQVGNVMGIPVQDHLIIGLNKYVSLREKGYPF